MIDYEITARALIEDVEEVIVEPVGSVTRFKQRDITVRTKHGETFYLILRSDESENLEFREHPKESWLTPKVYKGKTMHEEEMDE